MAVQLFDNPFIKSISIKNAKVTGLTTVTRGVNLALGESHTYEGVDALALLKAEYEKKNSVLKSRLDSGKFTATVVTSYTAGQQDSKVKSFSVTVGVNGVADCDFNFAANANTTAQNIDLGALIPGLANLESFVLLCLHDFGTTETISFKIGTASAGTQVMGSTACSDVDVLATNAAASSPVLPVTKAERHLWLNGVPSANWSTVLTGKWMIAGKYTDFGV